MIFTCQKAGVEKKKAPQPSRRDPAVLRQLVGLIPADLVPKLARETGVNDRAHTFRSHVVTMLHAQISHAFGLNDGCDALRLPRLAQPLDAPLHPAVRLRARGVVAASRPRGTAPPLWDSIGARPGPRVPGPEGTARFLRVSHETARVTPPHSDPSPKNLPSHLLPPHPCSRSRANSCIITSSSCGTVLNTGNPLSTSGFPSSGKTGGSPGSGCPSRGL